jgi:hypothetical protein
MEFSCRSVHRGILLLQCSSALSEQMSLEDFQARAGRRVGSWLPTRASIEKPGATVSRMRNRRTPMLIIHRAIYIVVVAAFVSRAVSMQAVAPSCGICPQGNESGAAGDFPDSALAVPTYPVGNAALTYTALSVAGTTGQDDEREFLVSLGLVSQKGNQVTPQTLSKLCFDVCAAVRTMRQASFKP